MSSVSGSMYKGWALVKFDAMKNGYNRYQVDDAIAKLTEENNLLKSKLDAYISQAEADKKNYDQLLEKYNILSRDIEIKERAANDIATIAIKEANDIVQSANLNADAIVKEALLSAREILASVSKLGLEAMEIKANLNDQLNVLTNAIENFDVPPIPNPDLMNQCDE